MNRAPFFMAFATLLLLPLMAEPFATPDTIEMVASGRCLLGNQCSGTPKVDNACGGDRGIGSVEEKVG